MMKNTATCATRNQKADKNKNKKLKVINIKDRKRNKH